MKPLSLLRLLASFFLLLGGVRSTQAQERDTLTLGLEESIQRSLEASPEVDQREAQQNFAEARYGEARASRFLTEFQATTAHAAAPGLIIPDDNPFPEDALYLNPDVDNDWSLGAVRPFNRIELEALQPIYTWGELSGNIRAARYGMAVEGAEVRAKALEVAYRTAELYYNVLLTGELFRIARQAGDLVDRARDEVQRLLDEGAEDVDQADLYQVKLTEQEYRQRVVEVTQRRQTARSALARQLFLPEGAAVAPEDQMLQPIDVDLDSLSAYIERGLANRPEPEQAEAGLQARQAQVEVARSDYYPKLFLRVTGRAQYAAGRPKQDNAYIGDSYRGDRLRAGLGLRQQLNFAKTRAQVEQAEAERNEVRYQQQAARQLVRFEVEEAYRNMKIAQAALDAQEQSRRISNEWRQLELTNFDLGFGDTENLVDVLRADLELEVSYYEAIKTYNLSVMRLWRATGTLVKRLQSGTLVDES